MAPTETQMPEYNFKKSPAVSISISLEIQKIIGKNHRNHPMKWFALSFF